MVFTGESSFQTFLGGAGFRPSTVWTRLFDLVPGKPKEAKHLKGSDSVSLRRRCRLPGLVFGKRSLEASQKRGSTPKSHALTRGPGPTLGHDYNGPKWEESKGSSGFGQLSVYVLLPWNITDFCRRPGQGEKLRTPADRFARRWVRFPSAKSSWGSRSFYKNYHNSDPTTSCMLVLVPFKPILQNVKTLKVNLKTNLGSCPTIK